MPKGIGRPSTSKEKKAAARVGKQFDRWMGMVEQPDATRSTKDAAWANTMETANSTADRATMRRQYDKAADRKEGGNSGRLTGGQSKALTQRERLKK